MSELTITNNNVVTFDSLGQLGQLGNQLFQIAAVVGIANELGYNPVFPEFENSKYFKGVFEKEMHSPFRNECNYNEPYFHFQKFDWSNAIFKGNIKDETASNRINLYGYFQSEKYFENCIDEVLAMLEFEDSLRKKCKAIYKDILLTNKKDLSLSTCAIHMRFGDYLNNKGYYVQLSETDYYRKAISHILIENIISRKTKHTLFLVFSDDKAKAEEAIKKMGASGTNNYLIINNLSGIEEFCLQSLCDHFITANSSYSWWASYLSKNENKIIIQPKKWFGIDAVGLNTKDLYIKGSVLF